MSCEGACAQAHMRCAIARVRVRAKSFLKSVRVVRACGPFMGVRCASTHLHLNINEGLGLLKLADTSLILINPSPSNVKKLPAK